LASFAEKQLLPYDENDGATVERGKEKKKLPVCLLTNIKCKLIALKSKQLSKKCKFYKYNSVSSNGE